MRCGKLSAAAHKMCMSSAFYGLCAALRWPNPWLVAVCGKNNKYCVVKILWCSRVHLDHGVWGELIAVVPKLCAWENKAWYACMYVYGMLACTCVGSARTVFIYHIWPYIWWFPCQKYLIYTGQNVPACACTQLVWWLRRHRGLLMQ